LRSLPRISYLEKVKIFNIFPGIAKEKMQINKTQRMFRARCLLRISFLSIFLKNIPKSKGKAARKIRKRSVRQ
jgi:hypothetical protein